MKKTVEVRGEVPQHWVGDGFPVRSLFSYHEGAAAISPFLLLDYAGPMEFPPSPHRRGVDVHPHRGFETVTIVYHGEVEHRDSGGNHGIVGPGDVQWMTAASGVVHEEYHGEAFTRRGGVLEMVQLWVNLPAAEKTAPPRYQEILAASIPTVELPDGAGTARVIAGELGGVRGPARTVTPINVWDLQLAAGSSVRLDVPDGFTTLLLVRTGVVKLNGSTSAQGVALVRFDPAGDGLEIACDQDASILALSGEPIDEPVVGRGPFVMNTEAEIRQAILDFQAGRMGVI
ncbi:pirin family protein [Paludisphaera rhizosphaerae]|uniref:pirin family protein n=1 Tax=Paludisphaera rhizosphaerae TaxID=2711216 RepID=UPI0038994ABE